MRRGTIFIVYEKVNFIRSMMVRVHIGRYSCKVKFPRSFKDIIKKSGITRKEIAAALNLKLKRVDNMIDGNTCMDHTEFRDMKQLIDKLNRR